MFVYLEENLQNGTARIYKKSLIQIKGGVNNVRKEGADARSSAYITIQFDVSISTNSVDETKTGAGIFVASFGVGGSQKDSTINQNLSRIQFSIPLNID